MIYSIVDSIIHAFPSSFKLVNPKKRVSTIIESFWFNKERFDVTNFSKKSSLTRVILAMEKEVDSCFNMPTAVVECV